MQENKDKIIMPHSMLLKDRQELHLAGVTDVDSFDETGIVAYTDIGELSIGGENLHITKLSHETGELLVCKVVFAVFTSVRYCKMGEHAFKIKTVKFGR